MPVYNAAYLSTGLDLQSKIVDTELCDFLQERFCLLGILVNPRLALNKQLGAAALHHIAQQRPRRAAEAKEGYSALELPPCHSNGLVYVIQLLGYIDVPLHDFLVLLVVRRLERIREMRTLLVHHFDDHAHGLRYHKNVGENDGGIEEAGETFDGLQGDGRGDFGIAAALEKVAGALGFMVLWEVTAGLEERRSQ